MGAYVKSKTLAEKAAWEFQASIPEGPDRFDLVTILPAFVMGPPIRKEKTMSHGWITRCMSGAMTSISGSCCCVVDVRDVAFAHLQAIKVEAAANQRFLLVHSSPSFHKYAEAIQKKYIPLGWPIPTKKMKKEVGSYTSLYDNSASR